MTHEPMRIVVTLDAQLLQAGRLRQAVLKRAFEGRLVSNMATA